MLKTKLIILFFLCLFTNVFSQTPPAFDSISLWLVADSLGLNNNEKIVKWDDLSGIGYKAEQTNLTYQPTFKINQQQINNHAIATFSSSFLTLGNHLNIDSIRSFFIIIKQLGFSNYPWYVSKGYTPDGSFAVSTVANTKELRLYADGYLKATGYNADTTWAMYTVSLTTDSMFFYSGGNLIGGYKHSKDLVGTNSYDFYIGNNAQYNSRLTGQIAEILIYHKAIGRKKEKEVEKYLQNKYAPPVNINDTILIKSGFADTSVNVYKPWFKSYKWFRRIAGSLILVDTDSLIVISDDGTYIVEVTDQFGIKSIDSVQVIYPVIHYPSYANDTICLGDTLFWDTGLGADYSYSWTPNQVSTTIYPITTAGKYSVKITDNAGYYKFSDTITIAVDSFPIQNKLGPDRDVCKYEAVSLLEQGSGIQSYLWSTNVTNSYINIETAADYSVTVINSRGCQGTDTALFGISGEAPVVSFAADTICYGDSTSFLNLTTVTPPNVIANFTWTFGDNVSSSEINPKHLYQSIDTFIVRLNAVTTSGCNNFYQDCVLVRYRPTANFFTKYGYENCFGNSIQFYDSSLSILPIDHYSWNFGDNGASSQQNPIYTYNIIDNYQARLKITASNNCNDSIIKTLSIVNEMPAACKFNLLSPYNGTVLSDTTFRLYFSWENSKNAIHYLFEIASDSLFSQNYSASSLDTSNIWYTISQTGTWYWKVTAYNICGAETTSPTSYFKKRDLNENGTLVLWLNADNLLLNAGDNVSSWSDFSIEGFNAIQTDPTLQPKFVDSDSTINYNSSINFNSDYLSIGNHLNIDSVKSFFIVARQHSFINYPWYISKGYTADGCFAISTSANTPEIRLYVDGTTLSTGLYADTTWALYTVSLTSDSIYLYSGDNLIKTFKHGQDLAGSNAYDFRIGGNAQYPSSFFDGQIAEIIIYADSIGRNREQEVEQYLRYKYTPPVNLTSNINMDYGFADTTISAYKPWFSSYIWTFLGDTISTDSVISAFTAGTYKVFVTDIFGFTSSDSVIVAYPIPKQISDTTICRYDTLTWNPGLKGDYSYEWGASTSSATPASLPIVETGDYWVIIKDNQGNPWYSDTAHISVNEFPATVSLGNDTTLCKGNRIYLAQGLKQSIDYHWSDGTTEDYLLLENAGTYSVTVTDSMGCVGRDSAVFGMEGIAPVPDFTVENQCIGDITQFKDISVSPDGSELSGWNWQFGDSASTTSSSPAYRFNMPGTYTVTLRVNTENCSNTLKKSVQIYHRPEAGFGPTQVCSNSPITLNDKSTSKEGAINSWLWTLPDDSVLEQQNPEYTFTTTGNNKIQLIVQTEFSCRDTVVQAIDVKPGLRADFTYGPACKGNPVYFTDASQSFLSSTLNYEWTFENGDKKYVNNPWYLFPDTGSYSVNLKVFQDINNCSNEVSKVVRVYENPAAAFNFDVFCEKNPGHITDASTSTQYPINSWKWDVENLGRFSGPDLMVKFDSAGNYNALLKITDENGCLDTVSHSIAVYALPVSSFTTSEKDGPLPLKIDFTNQTTGASFYSWNFGDGAASSDINPSHTYSDSGTFEIQLRAVSDYGCTNESKGSVRAIVPMIDLSVLSVTAEVQNGFLKVIAEIQNRGSLDMKNVIVSYKANYGQALKEVIPQTIPSTRSINYTFSTEMAVKTDVDLTYVCVTVQPNGSADELPDDNEYCLAFEEAFKTMHPYPNPAHDKLIVEYIIPFDAPVKIELYNQFGKLTEQLFDGPATAGYNRHVFDVRSLSKGIYIYRIEYEGNVKSYQVVIN